MVSEFLPNMRGLVSHELHESGRKPAQDRSLLGITQARVSYYLGIKKGRFVSELASKFALSQSEVQSYGRILSEDVRRSEVDGIFTLYSIWRNLLFTGGACSIHQERWAFHRIVRFVWNCTGRTAKVARQAMRKLRTARTSGSLRGNCPN